MRVAIVGGGISGICSAKSCLSEGLSPTIFEASSTIGGAWTSESDALTGVFENLITNTPFYENTTTDILPLRKGPRKSLGAHNSLFMTANEWFEYIQYVIDISPGLSECISLGSKVTSVNLVDNKYIVSVQKGEATNAMFFDKVIIATGNNQVPNTPSIPGIENFKGLVMHSQKYKSPSQVAGKTVLIVGGSISGAECAGNMCASNLTEKPKAVTLITRSMKHFLLKENKKKAYTSYYNSLSSLLLFSGAHSISEEQDRTRPDLETYFSKNSYYGLPQYPPGSISVPVSHSFLSAVKSKKTLKVEVDEIQSILENGSVKFKSGKIENHDIIIFATGYRMNLHMFDESVREKIFFADSKNSELRLYKRTWAPALPGCAFVGLFSPSGAVMATVEMQSRWVARAFADESYGPTQSDIISEMQIFEERRKDSSYVPVEFHEPLMFEFAKHIGCEINYAKYPNISKCLLCGPFLPIQFRLFGHQSVENPVETYKAAAKLAGIDAERFAVGTKEMILLEKCLEAFKSNGYIPPGFEQALEKIKRDQAKDRNIISRIVSKCIGTRKRLLE